MNPSIAILPEAQRDLDEIADYTASHNWDAAIRFSLEVDKAFVELSKMPGMGPRRSFNQPKLAGMRFWPVPGFENYLIVYRTNPAGIEIVRVLHGARNLPRIFKR